MKITSEDSFRILSITLGCIAVILNCILDLSYTSGLISKIFICAGAVLILFSQQFSEISSQGGNIPGLFSSSPNIFGNSKESGSAFKFLGSIFIFLAILIAIFGIENGATGIATEGPPLTKPVLTAVAAQANQMPALALKLLS